MISDRAGPYLDTSLHISCLSHNILRLLENTRDFYYEKNYEKMLSVVVPLLDSEEGKKFLGSSFR